MTKHAREHQQSGASAVEYSLIVVSIAAVIVLLVTAVGGYTQGTYKKTCDNISATGVQNLSTSVC